MGKDMNTQLIEMKHKWLLSKWEDNWPLHNIKYTNENYGGILFCRCWIGFKKTKTFLFIAAGTIKWFCLLEGNLAAAVTSKYTLLWPGNSTTRRYPAGNVVSLQCGSTVKNVYYCWKGPGFSSQYLFGGSQPFCTPVPRDLMPSSELWAHCTHVVHRNACRQNVYT